MTGRAIGVDVGGSGIKGAPVDLAAGSFAAARVRIATPQPSTPASVAAVVAGIVKKLEETSGGGPGRGEQPVGATFPAVIQHGVARTAANVDAAWIGTDVQELFSGVIGRPVVVVNDADAAGVAEARFGAARAARGLVFMATLGTGIGSVLLLDGNLVPNTELGHLQIDGHDAESRASDAARAEHGLDWHDWAQRLQRYFSVVEDLFWPDLIVVGGGVSKKHEKFLPLLHLRAPIVPAQLRNEAGIIGAAVLAAERAG